MALILCPECKKEISDRATSCPHCGYPIKNVEISNDIDEAADNKETGTEIKEIVKSEQSNKPKKTISKKAKIIGVAGIVVVICVGLLLFFLTAHSRTYNSAMKSYQSGQYEDALTKFQKIVEYNDSEEMIEKCEYELSVEGRFMRALSEGLMERWDLSKIYGESLTSTEYNDLCDAELKHIESFLDETFLYTNLQEDAFTYIGYIQTAKDSTRYYTIDYNTFYTIWHETYAKRTILLKKFVTDYGLTVDAEYQETLDDLMIDASAAQDQLDVKDAIQEMTESFIVETTVDRWGYYDYKATIKNTTDRTFDYFGAEINVIDAYGNIVTSGSLGQVSSWKPGQEAIVDVYISGDFNLADYTLEYIPHYQTGSYYE